MATLTYSLRLNADGTLTVKVGRSVESIALLNKSKGQIFDAVRWALISKNVSVSNDRLTRDLYDLIWKHL